MKTSGNVVVITGGTSGIGLATAKLLSADNKVIVLGRSAEKLARAKAEVPALGGVAVDVTDENALRAALAAIAGEHGGISVLLNAAGASRACRFAEDDDAIAIARNEINTNLMGTIIATKLALPWLLKQPEAAVITISSGIALAPHLNEPTHSATKAALHAFCRCLRDQLKTTAVRVIEVLPPLTETPNTAAYAAKKAKPEDIARAIVRGLAHDTPEVTIGIVKALVFLSRLAPDLAARVVTNSGR